GQEVARTCGGRALAAPDLHLTIAFVGNRALADSRLLLPPALALPGELLARDDWPGTRVERLASFGRGIVWAGPEHTPPWLAELALTIRAALRAAGIGFDEKPLRPHVTLVRGARRWAGTDQPSEFAPVQVASWRLALGWSGEGHAGARYHWHTL
ncbi:MAG: hypothetical protein K0B16_09070, partial [Burkholderiaceae bacterium]|nr:hypothetical protein [Burkholderiaceae bacterium]